MASHLQIENTVNDWLVFLINLCRAFTAISRQSSIFLTGTQCAVFTSSQFLHLAAATFGCGEDLDNGTGYEHRALSLEIASARLRAIDIEEADETQFCQRRDTEDLSSTQFALPLRVQPIRRPLVSLQETLRDCMTVPYDLIVSATKAVPRKNDGWSCGLNSAARFAAMLGHPIANYAHFHKHGPGYLGWGPFPKIGANPEGIQDYLRERGNMSDLSIRQRCTKDFHPNWEIMVRALQMGRPALVLVMLSGTSMHWVNIIARHYASGNWFFMDTDGEIFELPGGDDELRNWMSTGHCMAQRFGFIERFNTITTTRNN